MQRQRHFALLIGNLYSVMRTNLHPICFLSPDPPLLKSPPSVPGFDDDLELEGEFPVILLDVRLSYLIND